MKPIPNTTPTYFIYLQISVFAFFILLFCAFCVWTTFTRKANPIDPPYERNSAIFDSIFVDFEFTGVVSKITNRIMERNYDNTVYLKDVILVKGGKLLKIPSLYNFSNPDSAWLLIHNAKVTIGDTLVKKQGDIFIYLHLIQKQDAQNKEIKRSSQKFKIEHVTPLQNDYFPLYIEQCRISDSIGRLESISRP